MPHTPRDVSAVEIPEELKPLLDRFAKKPEISVNRLEEISQMLEGRRMDAIAYRESCGIDGSFETSEEAYHGIDDANRHEFHGLRWCKPTTMDAPVQTERSGNVVSSVKSTAFVRLTARYVDAGAAKIGEILLSDKSFTIDPTPIPNLLRAETDPTQLMNDQNQPMWREAFPNELLPVAAGSPLVMSQPQTDGGQRPQQIATSADQSQFKRPMPMTAQDAAIQTVLLAKERAKRAETQIHDWMIECGHNHEMRKMLFDAARLGVGILKGPIPERRRTIRSSRAKDGSIAIQYVETIVPADRWCDPWNVFPSPDCGENINQASYIWEREFFSQKQLEDLIGLPGYIESQIMAAIEKGPQYGAKKSNNRNPVEKELKDVYEVWFFTGVLTYEDFKALNPKAAAEAFNKKGDQPPKTVFALVTTVNGIPIKGALNPLNSGSNNYYSFPWQRRTGRWDGVGVAEQIQVPQRIVNAATRALLNNAGISAGPQIILNRSGVEPADGKWYLTPNKIWYATDDGVIDDVRKAFFSFDISNVTKQMLDVIEYGLRLGEESTNIPLVTQGQSGDTTPETFGATQLQNNNANQLLRSIAYTIDGHITEPLVTGYYEYLLLSPDVPDEVKGDDRIQAKGSIALVERSIQNQTIVQMGPLALNPVYGVNPKKWFAQMARANYLEPADFQYSPEEQAKIDSQPPPLPPNVQVAQINAESKKMQIQMQMQLAQSEQALDLQIANIEAQADLAAAKMANETAQLKVKMDTDRDTVYVQSELRRAQAEYTSRREELALKKELAIMEFASKHQLSLDQVKAKLADTAMKLRVQKELAAAQAGLDAKLHTTPSAADLMKPPTEPPGRAPNGSAFIK